MNSTLEYILVGIITLGVLIYLFIALLRPRNFNVAAYRLFCTQVRKNLCL